MTNRVTQQISGRELHRLARRTLCRWRQDDRVVYESDHWGRAKLDGDGKAVRCKVWVQAGFPEHTAKAGNTRAVADAVCRRLGTDRLPRGMGPRVEAAAAAVKASRLAPLAKPATLAQRLRARLASKVRAEAERRGLPVWVDLAKTPSKRVEHIGGARDAAGRWIVLLRAEGYADYGSSVRGSTKALAILGGWDDNGLWAVRVPGTMSNVRDALDWLKPAAVRKAEESGKRVLRQGDVWIVELRWTG